MDHASIFLALEKIPCKIDDETRSTNGLGVLNYWSVQRTGKKKRRRPQSFLFTGRHERHSLARVSHAIWIMKWSNRMHAPPRVKCKRTCFIQSACTRLFRTFVQEQEVAYARLQIRKCVLWTTGWAIAFVSLFTPITFILSVLFLSYIFIFNNAT